MPVRIVPKNFHSLTGLVSNTRTQSMTAYASSLERDFLLLLDVDPDVEFYEEQPLKITYDDVDLRQAIEKQLNKGENANQFSKAISFGNHHAFLYSERVDQELAEGCRRLMKNAIICWNYLYLSQKIGQEHDTARRHALLTAVQQGSVASWRHVNVHGEYDFSEEKMQDSVGLQPLAARAFRMSSTGRS